MISCIYALIHTKTGRFIVGSTKDFHRRKKLWARKFQAKKLPEKIIELSTSFDDWELAIVERAPSSNSAWLEQREREVIDACFAAIPDEILNQQRLTTRAENWAAGRGHGLMSRQTYYRRRREGMTHEEAAVAVNRWYEQVRAPAGLTKITWRGEPVTQAEAARQLGCRNDALKLRLRAKRRRGVFEVTLEQLLVDTRRWRSRQ